MHKSIGSRSGRVYLPTFSTIMNTIAHLSVLTRLVVVVAGACSGSSKAPIVAPGQSVVVGDATFRTREGGAIDVNVKRTYGEHDATGTATLHGMTLDAAEHSALVGVATARAWLAIEAALGSDSAAASAAAQHGIDELGTAYRDMKGSRHIMDDTGNGILFAKAAADNGDQAGAADELTKVLRERVAIYLRAFAGMVE